MRFSSAHLVANSFGCQVLAEFALRHAERVDRLVFQGPSPPLLTSAELNEFLAQTSGRYRVTWLD